MYYNLYFHVPGIFGFYKEGLDSLRAAVGGMEYNTPKGKLRKAQVLTLYTSTFDPKKLWYKNLKATSQTRNFVQNKDLLKGNIKNGLFAVVI